MSTPIKETPILYGKDSDRFLKAIRENETNPSKKISKKEYEDAMKLYDAVMANAKNL